MNLGVGEKEVGLGERNFGTAQSKYTSTSPHPQLSLIYIYLHVSSNEDNKHPKSFPLT